MNDEPISARDPVEELCDYINKAETYKVDEEMAKDNTEQEYKNMNLTILSLGFPSLGNLTLLSKDELRRTNSCIKSLLSKIEFDETARKQFDEKYKELEHDVQNVMKNNKEREKEIMERDKEIEKLRLQLKANEQKIKAEKEKLLTEKEDTIKKCVQAISQQTVYQTEIKKKEKELTRLRDYVAKSKLFSATGIDMGNPLSHSIVYNKSNEDALLVTLTKGYEDTIEELKTEVKVHQDLYKAIQNEMETWAMLRKTGKSAADVGITKITDVLFNYPKEISASKTLSLFKENLEKLKQFMSEADLMLQEKTKEESEDEGKNCIDKILDRYTELAKAQAESIQKMCECRESTTKTLGKQEFENMWKIISANKKVLDENNCLISEEKLCSKDGKMESARLAVETFSIDNLGKALTQDVVSSGTLVSPSFANMSPPSTALRKSNKITIY